jgi:GDPmannose 4,6-dehydratase
MAKRALITGITGQDGSYLAEFLLGQGYEVIGMLRRSSTVNFERIAHIQGRVTLVPGDLLDEVSMVRILRDHRPTEVYNLAAQSFVQTSWSQPVLTGETTALGVTRVLDAIRLVEPGIRFYQASSSEMFGKVQEVPQNERTPFHPRSPYGVAKVYGHWITVNYRESYGLHASSGLCFNHESVPSYVPVTIRKDGYVDVVPIGELIPADADCDHDFTRFSADGGGLEVWNGVGWTRCTARTAYWHEGESVVVHGRGGIVECTPGHVVFTAAKEKPAEELDPGERLRLAPQPDHTLLTTLTEDEAWLLGLLAAEGYIDERGSGCVTCGDEAVLAQAASCWERVSAGTATKGSPVSSAFGGDRTARLFLRGNRPYLRLLRHELYTKTGKKRVPKRILNAAPHVQLAFLAAYNLGDGLRAGHGTDNFKSFRTTSPTLAAGLVWLARTTLGRRVSVYLQPGALGGGDSYLINLSSSRTTGRSGAHLRKAQDEVRFVERRLYRGWMCDLATESGRFAAGVGMVVVHNSPRRGLEFVTRKISHGVARIKLGLDRTLPLGNLEAQRDWGFAGDYVRAMWLMLQQEQPDDYVVASGETHSVREFCELAFGRVGLDYRDHVVLDERFVRPAEVDLLVGDASRARAILGWKPEVAFPALVAMMVDADLELVARQETTGEAQRGPR